jgi:hypothetical protein
MIAWKNQLSALELAAVITYVRNSFGNAATDLVQPSGHRRRESLIWKHWLRRLRTVRA